MSETLFIVSEICAFDKEHSHSLKEVWNDMVMSGKIVSVDEYESDDFGFMAKGKSSDGNDIEVTYHDSLGYTIEHFLCVFEEGAYRMKRIPDGFGYGKISYVWHTGTDMP